MTKVLCIGYYDKFSRFFLQIKKQFTEDNRGVHMTILSTYLSGFLYSFIRFQGGEWISAKAWIRALKYKKIHQKYLSEDVVYKGININELLDNYQLQSKHLKWQAMAYVDIFEKKLKNIDVLLMIGDLRLPFEIAKKIARQNNIPIYFLEQGPFSTTFVDQKGVNANAGIRGYSPNNQYDDLKKEIVQYFLNRSKKTQYRRSPFYRGLDYLLELLFAKTILFPPDLKIDNPLLKNSSKLVAHKFFEADKHTQKNIFLLICQVPFDVNMTHHSPHYNNHTDILTDVHQNLPENSILIVREHPVYSGKYEEGFYRYILAHENIYIDKNKDFNTVLDSVNAVIVNNSTVGLEAISRKKNVLVLANSYYDSSDICLKMNDKNELRKLLKELLFYQPDNKKITDFLYYFFSKQVVEGFITDKEAIASDAIFTRIFKHYKN